MPSFELMAALDELAPGSRKSIFVDDLPALLLRIDNDYFAIEDVCTHDGQPLTDGPVIDGQIVCPRHGARFDLADGRPTKMPATSPIRVFAVDVRSDGVYVSPKAPGTVPSTPKFVATPAPAVPEATAEVSQTPVQEAGEADAEVTDEALIEALRTVIDPELMINIVDLGLVYNINQNGRKVAIEMTLTSPACPAGPQIIQQSRTALERVSGIDEATIKLVMTPPWSPERMTDEARDQLGIF